MERDRRNRITVNSLGEMTVILNRLKAMDTTQVLSIILVD